MASASMTVKNMFFGMKMYQGCIMGCYIMGKVLMLTSY